MNRITIIILLVILNISVFFGQNSLNDLNIIFKHDFENNTLGDYNLDEWKRDFNYPEWNCRQSTTEIMQNTTDPVNPTKTLQLNFPANSVGSNEGGAYWWTKVEETEEAYLSFDVYFMPGFQYQIGGKLPGMQGGDLSSDGGSTGYDGFTAGMMFKENGRLVQYMYYPDSKEPKYGESFTWGCNDYSIDYFKPSSVVVEYGSGSTIYCKAGEWHNITHRIVLNTVNPTGGGNYDGILEAYFDGKMVTQISHILFRHTSDLKIDNLRIISFFGGGTDEWRNPIEEWLRIDNILLYTFKESMNVPRGNTLSPTSRTINYWRNFEQNNPSIADPSINYSANNAPMIVNQKFTVYEKSFQNNFIGKVVASDNDPEQKITYSIIEGDSSGIFIIDKQNGELKSTRNDIFGPGLSSYELTVKVSDNASNPKSNTARITINLIGESSVFYIDPDNTDDLFQIGSISHPFDSWNDIIWKEGYTYLQKRGTVSSIDKLLIDANHVTLGAYGSGSLPIITSNTNTYLISGFEKSYITIKNLHFQADKAVSCIYFLGSTSDSIIIDHCVFNVINNSIRIVEGNALVAKYNTIISKNEGIYSTASTNDIFYNIFESCKSAINIVNNDTRANIYNNVFADNEKSLSTSYADITLYNNIFYMTSVGQKAIVHGNGRIISDNNIYFPEQDGFIEISENSFNSLEQLQQKQKIDLNSFNLDPEFVDVDNCNFKVKSNSPAINAGRSLNINKDFVGIDVPIAGITDIGAFEFTGIILDRTDNSKEPIMTLYPNPTAGEVNILAELDESNSNEDNYSINWIELKILDISGKTIISKNVLRNGSYIQDHLDLSGFSNGFYFVILYFSNKIIKQKLILNK